MKINHHALRSFRSLAGRPVGDLAAAVGITSAHLSNVEAGRRGVSEPVLVALAEALDVKPEALVGADMLPAGR